MTEIIPIRLSQLTGKIQQTIQNSFASQTFWVFADITSYSFYSQKSHHYFDLVEKEEGSNNIRTKISAAAWSTGNLRIIEFEKITGQKFTNDIHVLVKVSVEYHPVHGLKLILLDVDPNFTIGVLEQQRQQTLQRLLQECSSFIRKVGDEYITTNKELPLPQVIQRIAVVTSKSSAGLEDFIHTIRNNTYGYTFSIDNYFTTVQGETGSAAIYNKLLEIFYTKIDYDVLVIIRGGGSQTDFLIFDQFPLSMIVAKYPLPIITGIGHQKNETIVDLMAHTSTKTPTRAAEFIIAHNRNFEEQIMSFQQNILIRSQQLFSFYFQALSRLNTNIVNNTRSKLNENKSELIRINQVTINTTKSIIYRKRREIVNLSGQISSKPKIIISSKLSEIGNIVKNLKSFSKIFITARRNRLNHFVYVFKISSPASILRKGFAVIKLNGKIIGDPDKINTGDNISVILSEKEIKTVVKSKTDYHGKDFII